MSQIQLDMTDKIKLYETEISQFLGNRDFNALSDFFQEKKISSTELLIFYRRKNKTTFKKMLFSQPKFWTSKLPHFHLKEILESDYKINFLESYFRCNNHCNHELNIHLASISKDELIKFFKLLNVFNKTSFLSSLKSIAESGTEIKRFVQELEIVMKAEQSIRDEAEKDKIKLLEYTFDEVALGFTLYYYRFKQNPKIEGNKNRQIAVEMTLVTEFNRIISIFREANKIDFRFDSNDELQEVFFRNEAPHKFLGKKKSFSPAVEQKYWDLYDLIENMINRNSRRCDYELYLAGQFDFVTTILNPALLDSNASHRLFKMKEKKFAPEEYYFLGTPSEMSKQKNNSRADMSSSLNFFNFYGIPSIVKSEDSRIPLEKALKLLGYFSTYKGPEERQFIKVGDQIQKEHFIMNQADTKFQELFGKNESISLFEYDILLAQIASYFNWTILETQSILSFLTFDLNSEVQTYSWISRPFLRHNDKVLWLGSFAKDRRWENIILNKLKFAFEFQSAHQTFAKNFEKNIERLFRKEGFNTISNEPFKSSNGQSGDFDVLVFKDNHLLVCEAKTGIRSDDFLHATKTDAMRLEGEAVHQLNKAIFNIKEDWHNIKTNMCIDDDISIEDLTITPLIVTDFFEGDLQVYKNNVLKTSLLELEVNLTNSKKKLLETYMIYEGMLNGLNKDYVKPSDFNINWDLWNGNETCSVDNLISNIKNNAVWCELEKIWKFDKETFNLYY